MKNVVKVFMFLLLLGCFSQANAVDITVGFDDLVCTDPSGVCTLPADYAGLTWGYASGNIWVNNWRFFDTTSPYTPSSPPCRVFTQNVGDGFNGWINFGKNVNFKGFYVDKKNYGNLYWIGYLNDVEMYVSPVMYAPGQNFVTVQWPGVVDKVKLVSPDDYFIIDDIIYDDLTVLNDKPIANAGVNQSLVQGETALLSGGASSDPNGDPLSYQWSIYSKPENSTAEIVNANAMDASIVPDLPGAYVISLVVNDGQLDSDPSNIIITVIPRQTVLLQTLQTTIDAVNLRGSGVFKKKNMAKTFTNKLNDVIEMVQQGQFNDAYGQMKNDIIKKTDGCAATGAPDNNDWVKDCSAQNEFYPLLMDALGLLEDLL